MPKPAPKPAPKSAGKAASRAVPKSASKPVPKPVPKQALKASPKAPAKRPAAKTTARAVKPSAGNVVRGRGKPPSVAPTKAKPASPRRATVATPSRSAAKAVAKPAVKPPVKATASRPTPAPPKATPPKPAPTKAVPTQVAPPKAAKVPQPAAGPSVAADPSPAVAPPAKPKKNTAGLGVRDLQHFADLLLAKRREIVGDMHSMEGEALRSGSNGLSNLPVHLADMGTDNYEQEFTLGLVEKDRSLLREINHALAKIPAGTFGVCEGTGEPIGKPRLEVQPWARYSIDYARQRERNGRGVRMFF